MKKFLEMAAKKLEGKVIVKIKLPGEFLEKTLFLTTVDIKSSMFEDFKNVFEGKLTLEEVKKAKSLFPKKKTENCYNVFLDSDFKPVFVVNRFFAQIIDLPFGNYNNDKKVVIFHEPKKIMLEWALYKELWKRKHGDPLMDCSEKMSEME